jgi:UDP-N-acetylmuramate dehydrogenase
MKVDHPSVKDVSNAVISIRQSKLPDPKIIGNAGSFFKNPVVSAKKLYDLKSIYPGIVSFPFGDDFKLAAGWLIEQAGWKGYREGNVGCHEKQALVLVNHGNASGLEILQLAQKIQHSVHSTFGVELEIEVNVI